MAFKIVWGITGSGYLLKESIDLMKELLDNYEIKLTVLLSQEGVVVMKWYKQWMYLNEVVANVRVEKTPNNPWIAGPLQIGSFDLFLICPASANTVAKIAYGFADNLLSNCVAQGVKGGMEAHILPSDQFEHPIETHRPDGSPLTLKIRDIEKENIEKIRRLEGIRLLKEFSEIKPLIIKKIHDKN